MSISKRCVLLLSGALAFAAHVQASEGLWVGTVVLDAVSEVNKPLSDLSFDLQLEGTLLEDDLVEAQSNWNFDSGTNHGTGWRETVYDDSTWSNGAGPFGYGANQAVTTTVDFGTDADDKHPTTYFRQTFDITDASIYTGLLLSYRRDDGIAGSE